MPSFTDKIRNVFWWQSDKYYFDEDNKKQKKRKVYEVILQLNLCQFIYKNNVLFKVWCIKLLTEHLFL